ncbi:MarR family transcriptional regulator [Gorillibacterium sp. CAU 1737]|uniref:MarR family winged helix-turn-helix transcriptional regulator n=1 Tax=Gorillibacterium sp. CAU 1737 TaxID=3140362 RepID=UPI0032608293
MLKEDPRDTLYFLFAQVIRLHFKRAHAHLEKIGLYPGQHPVLFILKHRKEGQSQKDIAEAMRIKPATLTVMLKRLENSGIVKRKPDEADQRITRVYLTEKGFEVAEEMERAMNEIDKECFKNFTVEEQALLRRFFMQMRDNLKEANKEWR